MPYSTMITAAELLTVEDAGNVLISSFGISAGDALYVMLALMLYPERTHVKRYEENGIKFTEVLGYEPKSEMFVYTISSLLISK
jgi:hypothetical protein